MCAHAVRVAIAKIQGVRSAKVSLNEGVAVVTFDSVNSVSIARLRDVIRDNGFTPKAADVKASGRIVDSGGAIALALPGVTRAIPLVAHPGAPHTMRIADLAVGTTVVIEGVVPETAKNSRAGEVIQVQSFSIPR